MRAAILIALVVCSASMPAHAGRSCEVREAQANTVERGMTLALRTHEALERQHAADGTQVVILARMGQDLSKYGLRYSHFGIAYRTLDAQSRPAWRVLHKLNQCGTAEAAVYRQGLGEFYLDDLWRYEGAWVTPTKDVQVRLLALLEDPARSVRLNHKPYSVVSYAWATRYQQSNQWALETFASALDPAVTTREQAQAWLRARGYQPTELHLGALKRLGGRMTAANVAFDDHPPAKRFSDRIETITVDSVFRWLTQSGLAGEPVAVRL